MSRLDEILEKRARLLAEAQAQRNAFAGEVFRCRGVLAVADRGFAWAGWLRARPYLAVAAAAALAALRPGRALGWSAQLLTLWKVGRLLYGAIRPAGRAP
jgi:YqjK-like protein